MQVNSGVKQWHNWQLCDKTVCVYVAKMVSWGIKLILTGVIDQMHTDIHTHKISNSVPGNECDFYLRLVVLRHQSADDMWWLMGDGCCHLVVSLLGLREGGGWGEARIISTEFRKCETAEAKCQSWELWTDGRPCTWWCACFVRVWWVWMSEGRSVIPPFYR